MKMEIVQIPINVIKPYFRNPRVNQKTVKALVEAIPKVGFNVPLVVDKDYVIIKGHARWKAGRHLGMEALPCIISDNSDEVNRLDRLADNKISELSEWNLKDLNLELSALVDVDITDFGFDALEEDLGWIEEPVFDSDEDGDTIVSTPMVSATPKSVERAQRMMESVGEPVMQYLTLKCPECGHEYKLSRDEVERLMK